MQYGFMLVEEQENFKGVQLADKYSSSAALGDANDDAINQGTFLNNCLFMYIVGYGFCIARVIRHSLQYCLLLSLLLIL